MHGHTLGQGLRKLAAGTEVGEQPVAARTLDGRGQGPRACNLDLQLARVAEGARGPGLLLEGIEVLGQQRPCPPVVGARCVGQSPTSGLQVEAEVRDQGEGPSGHARHDTAGGQLGEVRQVGKLAEHDAHGLVDVLPGQGTDTRRDGSSMASAHVLSFGVHPRTLRAAHARPARPIRSGHGSERPA